MKALNWIAKLKSLRLMGFVILLAVSGQVQAAPGESVSYWARLGLFQ